eukprot:585693-Amphidinium_carterae.1
MATFVAAAGAQQPILGPMPLRCQLDHSQGLGWKLQGLLGLSTLLAPFLYDRPGFFNHALHSAAYRFPVLWATKQGRPAKSHASCSNKYRSCMGVN